MMKDSSRYPKEVRKVVAKVNEWLEENTPEYDCDPYVGIEYDWSNYDYRTKKGKKVREYHVGSSFEDGFSTLVFVPKKGWFIRDYMAERKDPPLDHDMPWVEVIGIMAG